MAERSVPHLSPDELLAWRGLLETQSRLIRRLDEELLAEQGLSISEFDALYQLWVAPGMRRRMKDLAGAVLVTRSGITRLVDRLEDRGLVRRISQTGVQAVEAGLTPAGVRVLRQAMETHFRGVRQLFVSQLSPAEIRRLVTLWTRFTE